MKKISLNLTNINLKKVIFYTLGLAIFALVGYNAKDLIFGVPFKIMTATDGSTVYDTFLPIKGATNHAKDISINGRSVGLDRSGTFSDGALLSPGYNVVEIAMKDQFGNTKTKKYRIVVETKSETVAQSNKDQISEKQL